MIPLFAMHYNTVIVMLGTTILGLCCGAYGVISMLRKQSLLADALSHAALPGIALMFLVTNTQQVELLLCGGMITSACGALCIYLIPRITAIKRDATLGIVLSVFFGWGLVIMTYLQKQQASGQSLLNKFLFGSAATLLYNDLMRISVVAIFLLTMMYLFFKEISLLTFDPLLCRMLGYRTRALEIALTSLLTILIVIGLQMVGVILMSSLLLGPAVTAYQMTKKLSTMIIYAAIIGALSCAVGSYLSSTTLHIPTGPTIVTLTNTVALIAIAIGSTRTESDS